MSRSSKKKYDTLSDEELMRLSARDDLDAFGLLVRRYQQELVNFFRRMGDYSSADDLAQNTFLRLYRYRDRYKPRAKLKTFLYLLARRCWVDHCRSEGRRREKMERMLDAAAVEEDVDQPFLEDAKLRLREALGGLSQEMRAVVVMSVYQGLRYREIAEVLDIPLGTVKTRMFNALKKMRDCLDDEK